MNALHLEQQAVHFALASRLASYPGEGFAARVDELTSAGAGSPAHRLWLTVEPTEAQAEFTGLFEHGPERTPLYETEYGRMRGMSKGNELADISGFYRAFSLASSEDAQAKEMPDHLAVELEFYAVLLTRQAAVLGAQDDVGAAIIEDARRKFLQDHLGRFAPAVAQRENVQRSPLYGEAFAWVAALVDAECRTLGVCPSPLDFHQLEPAPDDEACCGPLNRASGQKPSAEP